MNKKTVSPQTQQEALKLAKATQKPGQTKDQTKLIAQGIEHGIALYKKQQKEKQRQADKERNNKKRRLVNHLLFLSKITYQHLNHKHHQSYLGYCC